MESLSANKSNGGSGHNANNHNRRVLHVCNIPHATNELVLLSIFQPFGNVLSCRIIRDAAHPQADTYAFVELEDHAQAASALNAMNHMRFLNQELRVSWATSALANGRSSASSGSQRGGVNGGYLVYVGDLPESVNEAVLRATFQPYGVLLEVKVVYCSDGTSRGYGFVTFEREEDAAQAILKLDRSWLMNKAIRANWAMRKGHSHQKQHQQSHSQTGDSSNGTSNSSGGATRSQVHWSSVEEVRHAAPETNTTVYCGGVLNGLSEDLIKTHFSKFGAISDIRLSSEKGFAFIRFRTHAMASEAIFHVNGQWINGYCVKCAWSKDANTPLLSSNAIPTSRSVSSFLNGFASAAHNAHTLTNSNNNAANLLPPAPNPAAGPATFYQLYPTYFPAPAPHPHNFYPTVSSTTNNHHHHATNGGGNANNNNHASNLFRNSYLPNGLMEEHRAPGPPTAAQHHAHHQQTSIFMFPRG